MVCVSPHSLFVLSQDYLPYTCVSISDGSVMLSFLFSSHLHHVKKLKIKGLFLIGDLSPTSSNSLSTNQFIVFINN